MICIAILKLYNSPACFNFSILFAYLSCLLFMYILASEALYKKKKYDRDIRHGLIFEKNWIKIQ